MKSSYEFYLLIWIEEASVPSIAVMVAAAGFVACVGEVGTIESVASIVVDAETFHTGLVLSISKILG